MAKETNGYIAKQGETQRRILEAAGKVFSERGFRNATVREICGEAGVNIAAINYHFGDKKGLYHDTLKYWQAVAFEKYPLARPGPAGSSEERLEWFIRQFMNRIFDKGKGSRFGKLVARELFDPTDGLDVVVERAMKPTMLSLSAIVGEILDKKPDDDEVRLCCMSIVGQAFYFFYAQPVITRLLRKTGLKTSDVESVVDHITRFSLAAMKARKMTRKNVKR